MPVIGEVQRKRDINPEKDWTNKIYGGQKCIWSACSLCGRQRWVPIKSIKTLEPVSHSCKKCNPPPIKVSHFEDGKQRTKQGYLLVHLSQGDFFSSMLNGGGNVMDHRLVMAKSLGRCLQKWEIVHHKNGIKDDNRIENLELTASNGDHIREHTRGYRDGYLRGLKDGRNAQVKRLQAEIDQLKNGTV